MALQQMDFKKCEVGGQGEEVGRGGGGGDHKLQQLFKACDLDGSGYIDQAELATICTDMSTDELTDVFKELDTDGDGRISVDEFARGFKEINGNVLQISRNHRRKSLAELMEEENIGRDSSYTDFVGALEEGFKSLSCQDKVCELYEFLHGTGNTDILAKLEAVIINVISDIRAHKKDGERLETLFQREKDHYDRLSRQLEEELEVQMQKTEERVRQEEQLKYEMEKIEMRKSLEHELLQSRENYKHLEQENIIMRERNYEDQMACLRLKVDELLQENRQLKSDVTDSHTNLAIIRSELATLRQEYNDKCHELEMEKDTMMDFIKEQDNLTRQLHLLHDANKKLHDTNDDLREAVDNNRHSSNHKRSYSSGSPVLPICITGKKHTENRPESPLVGQPCRTATSLAEEVVMAEALARKPNLFPRVRKGSYEEGSITEDIDSGHSTIRDTCDVDTESEGASPNCDLRKGRRHKRARPTYDEQESHDEMDTETDIQIDDQDADLFKVANHFPGSVGSYGSNRSLRSLGRDNNSEFTNSNQLQAPLRTNRRGINNQQEALNTKITKEPERMYKVVLAGDAAVGKSSFIMRLCKGKFVNNLSSTLGVDFQTKIVNVDGHTIALQLWDTAGQERFRSIAKSYFRRADGVLLLYDCTYERSFLNVREWLHAIENGAQKPLPIMLCANKTDLRAEMEASGRRVVKFEDGLRLSRSFEGLFIETSAKDGSHINEAVLELTRLLRTNEDLEVRSVGMQLCEMRNDHAKKTGCCKM